MRAQPLAMSLAALAACTPNIVNSEFLCGPNAACPSGQVCSGDNNTCVDPVIVQSYQCGSPVADAPSSAVPLTKVGCVSETSVDACLDHQIDAFWFRFTTPTNCSAIASKISITFPVAFEPLTLTLWNLDTNTVLAADAACASPVIGDLGRCIAQSLPDGANLGLQIAPAGGGDCGGACDYNRFSLLLATQ